MRELNAGRLTCLNQGAPERQSLQLRCTLRRDPAYTSEETERLQGVRRDPLSVKIREVAGGSRSQTHRRAAKGGFTQDDRNVRGLAPTHTILSFFGTFAACS